MSVQSTFFNRQWVYQWVYQMVYQMHKTCGSLEQKMLSKALSLLVCFELI